MQTGPTSDLEKGPDLADLSPSTASGAPSEGFHGPANRVSQNIVSPCADFGGGERAESVLDQALRDIGINKGTVKGVSLLNMCKEPRPLTDIPSSSRIPDLTGDSARKRFRPGEEAM